MLFRSPDAPFASARVGQGDVFVSEVDESDGSIALYRPAVSVLLNVSLDHKSMEELRVLFGDFIAAAGRHRESDDDGDSTERLASANPSGALVSASGAIPRSAAGIGTNH